VCDRRIARLEPDGRITSIVERFEGKRLNSRNDAVFASNGDLYFTGPPFGLPKAFDDPAKELDFSGVYRLAAHGTLTLLTREQRAPNDWSLTFGSGRVMFLRVRLGASGEAMPTRRPADPPTRRPADPPTRRPADLSWRTL